MKKHNTTSELLQKQRERNEKIVEKNRKYLSKDYLFSHVEVALGSNIILLLFLYGISIIFPGPWLESLICLDLIAIIFNGILCYRKHIVH